MRSSLKFDMITLKPPFSSPIRFSTGTRQSSKWRLAVSEAHQPIFLSGKRVKRGVSRSTSSSEMPPIPGPPVLTATV